VSHQDFASVSIDSLTTITGAGAGGACDDRLPTYDTPRDGAGHIAGAVYSDTGKLPTPAQMQGAENSLRLGRDWNALCSRIRSERSPGWQP
jgi:hypothetical protein